LEQIKYHPWFQIYTSNFRFERGIIMNYHDVPIDFKIVEEIV